MATTQTRPHERIPAEWSARPLRPIARWTAVDDGSGRRRLRMTWSVPEVTAPAITGSPAARRADLPT
jgi:hypothetical protein